MIDLTTWTRLGLAIALAATAGCDVPPPAASHLPTFQLPEQAEASTGAQAPVGITGAPPAATPPTPVTPPWPIPALPAPVGGSGGTAGFVDPEAVEVATSALTSGPAGAWQAAEPLVGTVTLVAPDHVLSTIVLPAGSGVTALHPTPLVQTPPATGWATVKGRLDAPPGADYLVSFRAPGLAAFHGQRVAADGTFEFQVPVAGSLAGVVMAVDRSEDPPLALTRMTLTAGATTAPFLLVLQEPHQQAHTPPDLPAGMASVA
ncbi:MAG: hypothetical protein ACK46X_08165, partial [Candidatus Sericytochromatia bacterium]